MNTFERGLQILACFEESQGALTVEDLSELTGLPKSTVYRYVHTLLNENLLEHDSMRSCYVLGHRLLSFARNVPGIWDMSKIAYPVMSKLSQEVGETILLLRRSGNKAICIERVEADQVVKFSFEKGKRLPLHAGASARIVMAYLPEDEVDELIQSGYLKMYTKNTITDGEQLKRILSETRKNRFAISDEEMDAHVRAIAVPILSSKDSFIAGLSVVGPTFRLTEEKTAGILKLLPKYVNHLSSEIEKYLLGDT